MEPGLIFGLSAALIGFFGMATVVILLLLQGVKASQIDNLTIGMTFRAGGTINRMTLTYPFITISVKQNAIQLEYVGQQRILWRSIDYKPELVEGIFSKGVRLSLNSKNDTVIWSPFAVLLFRYLTDEENENP